MKNKPGVLLLTAVMFVVSSFVTARASLDEGKVIFTTRCASCHNVNKQVVGPALAKVDQRRTIDWIINFVHSPKAMITKNDKDAVALYSQFNKIIMPDHPELTEDNIKNIVAYIKSEASVATPDKPPFAAPWKLRPNYKPISINNYEFFITYIGLVFLLVASLVAAVYVKELERKKQA